MKSNYTEFVKTADFQQLKALNSAVFTAYNKSLTQLKALDIELFSALTSSFKKESLEQFLRIKKNQSNKRNRIHQFINFYQKKDFIIVFATFTFKNESLEQLNQETRRRKVLKACNNLKCFDYCLNIDFSKVNREHYHGILIFKHDSHLELKYQKQKQVKDKSVIYSINNIVIDSIDYVQKIGLVQLKKFNDTAQCNYVVKLENHASKQGTESKRIIYKKNSIFKQQQNIKKRSLLLTKKNIKHGVIDNKIVY